MVFGAEHPEILQEIEAVVAKCYGSNPDLLDEEVLRVYEAAGDFYMSQRIGRVPRNWNPNSLEQALFEDLKVICDRQSTDADTLSLCLKQLCRSVEKWTRRSGPQGYVSSRK